MGNFLDDLFSKVFKADNRQPVNHKENFSLTEQELADVQAWQNSEESKEIFSKVFKSYHFKRAQINESPQVHVFSSPYANGFAVTYDFPFDQKSFSRLFLAFSRRVLDLGYVQISLDRKLEEVNDKVKVTEKFYFKPPLHRPKDGTLIPQLYGNITLEKISIDNQPSYIKLLATVYSDRLFENAESFDDLMDRLFDQKTHE